MRGDHEVSDGEEASPPSSPRDARDARDASVISHYSSHSERHDDGAAMDGSNTAGTSSGSDGLTDTHAAAAITTGTRTTSPLPQSHALEPQSDGGMRYESNERPQPQEEAEDALLPKREKEEDEGARPHGDAHLPVDNEAPLTATSRAPNSAHPMFPSFPSAGSSVSMGASTATAASPRHRMQFPYASSNFVAPVPTPIRPLHGDPRAAVTSPSTGDSVSVSPVALSVPAARLFHQPTHSPSFYNTAHDTAPAAPTSDDAGFQDAWDSSAAHNSSRHSGSGGAVQGTTAPSWHSSQTGATRGDEGGGGGSSSGAPAEPPPPTRTAVDGSRVRTVRLTLSLLCCWRGLVGYLARTCAETDNERMLWSCR